MKSDSSMIPLAFIFMTGLVWLLLTIQSRRILEKFKIKHPQVAEREIPFAFVHRAHPEKAIFVFRKKFAQLFEQDGDLQKERRRFLVLFILSLTVPVVGFFGGAVYFYLKQR